MAHSEIFLQLSAATRVVVSIGWIWMAGACGYDAPATPDGSMPMYPKLDPCGVAVPDSGPEVLGNTWLTEDEAREFLHLSQGSELFPVDWLLALRTQTGEPFLDPQDPGFGLLRDDADPQWNPGGLPIGMSSSPAQGEGLEDIAMFGFTCAACHVGEIGAENKVYRILGAPSKFDINSFRVAFAQTLGQTIASPQRVSQFIAELKRMNSPVLANADAADVASDSAAAGPLDAFLAHFREPLRKFAGPRLASSSAALEVTFAGPGRVDAFGAAHNQFVPNEPWALTAPVDYPRLWNLDLMHRYHWDGNTNSALLRNVGEAIGLGATLDRDTFVSSVRFSSILRLEALVRKIDAPRWPFELPDRELVGRGFELFSGHCAQCHSRESGTPDPNVGTDPNRAKSFTGTHDDRPFHAMLEEILETVIDKAGHNGEKYTQDAGAFRAPGVYQTRTLAGVWATAPYLHNGSVPSLSALLGLTPRPSKFALAGARLDVVKVGYCSPTSADQQVVRDVSLPGNSNAGHEYGLQLRARDKRALIAYLRTL